MLETSSLSAAVAVDGLQEAKIKSVVGRIAVLALMSTLLVSQPVPFSMDTPWNTIWNWLPIVNGPWFQCLLASLVVAFAGVFPLLLFNADSWTSDQREPRSPQGKATVGGGKDKLTVGGKDKLTVGGKDKLTVGGKDRLTIGGKDKLTVGDGQQQRWWSKSEHVVYPEGSADAPAFVCDFDEDAPTAVPLSMNCCCLKPLVPSYYRTYSWSVYSEEQGK
ncbi:unnamed protein product [Cyprideis torosa]|uniref:Uncharacterized protein n=1 Tax=Cyprideis torosa TaxID=163714 RepID=A0A7R8W7K5_9CRUS|nr:unnamed protein product [Cyprideis torosa]CAG0887637.1 unnamed protein product [Cyprideis torosa]